MSAPMPPLVPAASAEALLAAAEGAANLRGRRTAIAGAELSRPPAFGIDDETRALSGQLIRGSIDAAAGALIAEESSLAIDDTGAIRDRFVAAGLLERSGLAAAALLRAEEHRLATALVCDASELREPATDRLDPIDGAFAAEAFAIRAAESARTARTGDPLLPLHDLPAEDRHALFWQVAACLTDRASHGASDESLHRAASAAVARALARIDDEGIEAAAMRLARRLDDAGQLDDPLLAGTLAAGRIAALAAMLAVRAAIGFDDARAMLGDAARFAVLLSACDVSRDIAAAMILALSLALDRGHGPDPGDVAAELVEGYALLDVGRARAEIRRARLEPLYRDALAALAAMG